MKKRLFIITLILLAVTGCGKESIKSGKIAFGSSIPYYKKELQDRYQKYQKENPNLTEEEIITRTNIGLDQPYYTNTKQTPYLNKTYILSNKYLYMPAKYEPDNLEIINKEYTNSTRKLVKEAKEAFENLAKEAKTNGYTIRVISAYRSYEYQDVLYHKYVSQDGVEKADTYSARPGHSEHQTGLVVDVDNGKQDFNHFENTEEFIWMQNNAYKYGFILRYPKGKEEITGFTYESWHYRYVGEKIATEIKESDMTFDEYYVKFIDK